MMIEPDDRNRDPLPLHNAARQTDLVAAIERARHRVASPEMVERLTASVLQLTHIDAHRSFSPRYLNKVWILGGAIAATIVLLFSYGFQQPKLPEVVQETTSSTSITKISLVSFNYSKIEGDLDLADTKAEEVSEGIELAAIRLEIRESLERFYYWSQ
jgi:hypothetical protein